MADSFNMIECNGFEVNFKPLTIIALGLKEVSFTSSRKSVTYITAI